MLLIKNYPIYTYLLITSKNDKNYLDIENIIKYYTSIIYKAFADFCYPKIFAV